jgi:general secretion pathway protein E
MSDIAHQVKIDLEVIKEVEADVKHIRDYQKKIEAHFLDKITRLVDIILAGAILLRASDIHLEPQQGKDVRLRIRIDGVLEIVSFLPTRIYELALSRIKLLSGLKFNITRRAQDGRYTIYYAKREIEIRTSVLPSEFGETVVMRILDPESLRDVAALGMRPNLLKAINEELEKPNGMILLTGPTGSGKTTTLYAFLKKIQNPGIKIITIENPIEYQLEGISQTQVDPEHGYDFASGLSAIVRQDPDVILVGEIRDGETARIAIQAAMTGHLVFSTLHTNDAAGTIARLEALGVSSTDVAPALNISIAQRLVRRVCPHCSHSTSPTKEEMEELEKAYKQMSSAILPPLNERTKILKANPEGCSACNFTGYQDRIGIFEAFRVDDEMQNFILRSPSIPELRDKAMEKGMLTLYLDGMLKVLNQQTTLEEVHRVT